MVTQINDALSGPWFTTAQNKSISNKTFYNWLYLLSRHCQLARRPPRRIHHTPPISRPHTYSSVNQNFFCKYYDSNFKSYDLSSSFNEHLIFGSWSLERVLIAYCSKSLSTFIVWMALALPLTDRWPIKKKIIDYRVNCLYRWLTDSWAIWCITRMSPIDAENAPPECTDAGTLN